MLRTLTRKRLAGVAVMAVGLLAACDTADSPVLPSAAPDELALTINVSSISAATGEQVAVAIDQQYLGSLAGIQGFLRFDAASLEYVGQKTHDGAIVLVNDQDAARGTLRFAAVDADGFGTNDIGSFVFMVRRGGYTAALGLDVEEASAYVPGTTALIEDVKVRTAIVENRRLRTDGEGLRLTASDWMARVAPSEEPRFGRDFQRPGQYLLNLRFGDANLSGGAPTIGDVVFILNVSVGLNELLVDADATAANARDAVIAGNVFPQNDPGLGEVGDALRPGVTASDPQGDITLSDATTILAELGVGTTVVGEIIPGRGPLASNRVVVSGNITSSTTWSSSNVYELAGPILVTNGATLTIQPGTLIEGTAGTPGTGAGISGLFVQRDGRLIADGTPLQPIVFSCVSQPKFKGCWGGLVINGSAPLNEGTATSPSIPGRTDGAGQSGCNEKTGEGGSGNYGGCVANDNSGILRYVRVEYSGFRFTATNELNGLALQGVGNGTTIDYVQVHAGQDDGFELFGGTVNVKHLLITASSDDGFDFTEGWSGKGQYIIVQADSLDGDKGFENDGNSSNTAISTPVVWNVTVIGKANPAGTGGTSGNNVVGGLHVRVGAQPIYGNFIVMGYPFAFDHDNDQSCGVFRFSNSVFFNNTRLDNSDTGDPVCDGGDEAVYLQAGAQANLFSNPNLRAPFNVYSPDFRPAFGSGGGCAAPPIDPFFTASATHCGAVPAATAANANIPWYSGWSRGWATPTAP